MASWDLIWRDAVGFGEFEAGSAVKILCATTLDTLDGAEADASFCRDFELTHVQPLADQLEVVFV